ncbi:MAG: hypothetical protein R2856_11025 [Caldilineaceae bacterium]
MTFQAWSELTYASFLLIFVGIYFVWQVVASAPGGSTQGMLRRLGLSLRRQLPPFLLMGAVTVAGLAPFLWAMAADLRLEGDFFASGGGFADIFSADLMGYLLPTRLHPLLGAWAAQLPFPNDKGQQIYIGYTALILALVGAVWIVRRQGWRGLLWPLLTLWFGWLTLGAEAPGPGSLRRSRAVCADQPASLLQRKPLPQPVQCDVDAVCGGVGGFALRSLMSLMNDESRMGRVGWQRRSFLFFILCSFSFSFLNTCRFRCRSMIFVCRRSIAILLPRTTIYAVGTAHWLAQRGAGDGALRCADHDAAVVSICA